MANPLLEIKNLRANIDGTEILKGLNLTINPGEVHSIMGPNGSGKSTLAQVLAGNETYEVTAGEVRFHGEDMLELEADERARAGLFLAFQYPVAIPGVSNMQFLKAALNAHRRAAGEEEIGAVEFMKLVKEKAKLVELNEELLKRPVNEGFSGGEKKRYEIFQLALLQPTLAVLDETDSGLDIDALQHRLPWRERPAQPGARLPAHHPLSAPAQLHRAGFRACADGRPHRAQRRQGPGAGAGRQGLQLGRRTRNRCRSFRARQRVFAQQLKLR